MHAALLMDHSLAGLLQVLLRSRHFNFVLVW